MSRRPSDPPSTSKRGARRTRPSTREHQAHSPQSDPGAAVHRTSMTAQDWYRAEKARRNRDRGAQALLDEARKEYLALLASEAGGPKGGRPRKVGRPKKVAAGANALDFELDELGPEEPGEFEAGDAGSDDPTVEKL